MSLKNGESPPPAGDLAGERARTGYSSNHVGFRRRVTGSIAKGLHSIIKDVPTLPGRGSRESTPDTISLERSPDGGSTLRRSVGRSTSMKLLPSAPATVFKRNDVELTAHGVRESLFHSRSDFSDFRGFVNLAMLLLFVNCFRIAVENVMDYGVLADFYSPLMWLWPWPLSLNQALFVSLNIYVVAAFAIESFACKLEKESSKTMKLVKVLHWSNVMVGLGLPCTLVWLHHPPLFGAIAVVFETVVIWMKLISYIAVNEHYRTRPESRDRTESFRAGKKGGSSVVVEQPKHGSADPKSEIEGRRVRYPDNVTLGDIYYFMAAPTLCYELNFPRTNRIRKGFLFRRCTEVVLLLIIITSLVQQWIYPLVDHSLVKFDGSMAIMVTRTLKLAVPNNAIWLLVFYAYFHAFMNACAEVLRFGDRQFYRDWWNAPNVQYFWSNWNIPVHKWLQRHIYRPLRAAGVSKLTSVTSVFLLSAVLHEVVIGIPLGILKGYSIFGMLGYVPLALMINTLYDVTNMSKTWGNVLVWLSLLIGQPAGMLMYAVSYRKLHANDTIAEV